MKIVTINTDAGFYPTEKMGSYAYWIKGDGFFLRGSGLFKDLCKNSYDAEMKALINAFYLLEASGHAAEKIVVNRDNIFTKAGRGNPLERKLRRLIRTIKSRSIDASHKNYAGAGKNKYVEFRHVKSHLHTDTKKHWVNDWCDKKCKEELKKWKEQQILSK